MSEGAGKAAGRPRLVGLNHVALEVGNVEEALAFYGRIFSFALRGRQPRAAFIDMGDQFIALMEGPIRGERGHRHFGLVVDDRTAVRTLATEAGAELLDGPFLDFLDPWGNRVEVVDYSDIQFTKARISCREWGWNCQKARRRNGSWPKKGWPRRRCPRLAEGDAKRNSVLSNGRAASPPRRVTPDFAVGPNDPLQQGRAASLDRR